MSGGKADGRYKVRHIIFPLSKLSARIRPTISNAMELRVNSGKFTVSAPLPAILGRLRGNGLASRHCTGCWFTAANTPAFHHRSGGGRFQHPFTKQAGNYRSLWKWKGAVFSWISAFCGSLFLFRFSLRLKHRYPGCWFTGSTGGHKAGFSSSGCSGRNPSSVLFCWFQLWLSGISVPRPTARIASALSIHAHTPLPVGDYHTPIWVNAFTAFPSITSFKEATFSVNSFYCLLQHLAMFSLLFSNPVIMQYQSSFLLGDVFSLFAISADLFLMAECKTFHLIFCLS